MDTNTKLKTAWSEVKKTVTVWLIALVIGFGLGKVYTIDSIITDCKVLGMTRFGNVPMGCRIGEKA